MEPETVHRRRWWILAVLCSSLFVVGLDNFVLNLALPTIQRELGASSTQLVWIVDAYVLVYAALLFTSGALGDRFGRRLALNSGLVLFGGASLVAAFSPSPETLIGLRALMGVGAALIMPSTLSIINNVFPAEERGKAIGIWAGAAALGLPLGPIVGGFLLENFWWGSVLVINVPVVVLALGLGRYLVPESRDPGASRPDVAGSLLSIAGLAVLVYGIISASERGPAAEGGWTEAGAPAIIAGGVGILAVFVLWELRSDHPMLPMRFFRNRAFSGASATALLLTLGFAGIIFMLTLYLQNVLGYGPFEAGIRLLPLLAVAVGAPLGAALAARVGRKVAVTVGFAVVVGGLVAISTLGPSTEIRVLWAEAMLGFGLGVAQAPTVDALLGSLPRERSGVASAAQETSLQLGSTLGVAVVGSVLYSVYKNSMEDVVSRLQVPDAARETAADSLAGAMQVSGRLGGPEGERLLASAKAAFVDGMGTAALICAGLALAAWVVAAITLPSREQK